MVVKTFMLSSCKEAGSVVQLIDNLGESNDYTVTSVTLLQVKQFSSPVHRMAAQTHMQNQHRASSTQQIDNYSRENCGWKAVHYTALLLEKLQSGSHSVHVNTTLSNTAWSKSQGKNIQLHFLTFTPHASMKLTLETTQKTICMI